MALSQSEQTQYEKSQQEINATAAFLVNFQQIRGLNNGTGLVDAFDSCFDTAQKDDNITGLIPQSLVDIFDSVGPENRPYILRAMEKGINDYKSMHGGEEPRPDMVASALSAAARALPTKDEHDSAVNGTNLNSAGMESNSVIPAQAIVTIATRIANSTPLVAYLPNASGSNQVPIVYGRSIAKNSFGAVKAGDFLDGKSASLQYFDPLFEFVGVKDATDAKKYTLSPTIAYMPGTQEPDDNAKPLPFMGGRVRVLVNGVEVGNDATMNHAKFSGNSQIIAVANHNLVIKDVAGDVPVRLVSGVANLDANTIEVFFDAELPDDTEVSFELIADYERTEANSENPILVVPSVDIDLVARNVYAYPMRARYRATRDAIGQMQRELGIDMRSAVTALVSSKFMLEQNIRLLKRIKKRAIGFGRVLTADLSRGATDTAIFNNTSEQARELLVTVSSGKVSINRLLDVVPSGHDIYVTDKMSVLFDNLADDTHYRKISNAVGAPNQITRIGQIDGKTNVYHVPEDSQLLVEAGNAAEIMLIGRSADPVRNPFVGFAVNPFTVRESTTQDFVAGVTIEGTQASDLNPLERFADQCVVINVTNLPASVAGV